jgi:hypothetical protein
MKPLLWMAVGGFILALGIVLIVGGYISGIGPPAIPSTVGNESGALHWYGPNLILLGATISPIGAVILLYGIAMKPATREEG